MGPDVAIVVGHRFGAQGARAVDGTTEWVEMREVAELLAIALDYRDYESAVVLRDDRSTGLSTLPAKVNQTGARICVSLHFNGSRSRRAQGSEVLYAAGSARGRELAHAIQDKQALVLGLPDRGLKAVPKDGRGGRILWGTQMPAVVVEPVFGSEARGWATYKERRPAWIAALADAIVCVGGEPV